MIGQNFMGKCACNSGSQWLSPHAPVPNYYFETPASNSREMRNRAEKMRRDKLNSFITELATLVPVVAKSSKRMDKTSILRLSASYLRLNQIMSGLRKGSRYIPENISQNILDQLLCDQLGGFLIILSASGKIIFISHTVENLLGHQQTDLLGQSIFNLSPEEDHERLRMYLNADCYTDMEWRKYFSIRLKRAGPRTESAVYELINMMGMHRPTQATNIPSSSSSSTSSSSRELAHANQINDVWVFFATVIQQAPPTKLLVDGSRDEYITRHLVDGRIIMCDQRISFVAGYLIEEVTGMSAFAFMHKEDVRWVMIALRQMYDKGESRGSSCYRLCSRNGQFIYLKTSGFLEIDNKGCVESFICLNTLVDEKEGLKMIKDMKQRYSALVSHLDIEKHSKTTDNHQLDDPNSLSQAIFHLMKNLPYADDEEEECNGSEQQEYAESVKMMTSPSEPPLKRARATSDSGNSPKKFKFIHNSDVKDLINR